MNDQSSSSPLAGIDWGDVIVQAAAIVSACTPARLVEDVVQEGLRIVLENEAPWDGADKKTLGEHVADVAIRAHRNRQRTERRRRGKKMVGKVVVAVDVPPATPERELAEAQEKHRKEHCFRKLVESLADDPQASAVLDLVGQGVHPVAEQARQSGFNVRAIERARSRIAHRAEQIAQESEEDGASPARPGRGQHREEESS